MIMDDKAIILTPSQQKALDKLSTFIDSDRLNAFVLTGYAGTGKTTLMRVFSQKVMNKDCSVSFHASTGRAAKVLNNTVRKEVTTVHSLIYTFIGLSENIDHIIKDSGNTPVIESDGQLTLNFALAPPITGDNTVFIVDEASMISDKPDTNSALAKFGTGCLLTDLFSFAPNGKFIFVGDSYQLPPVNDTTSPALDIMYLTHTKGMKISHAELNDIVRQADSNDIIKAADRIRTMCDTLPQHNWVKFPLLGFQHIIIHPDLENLIRNYAGNIKTGGYNSCIMISYSNSKCKQYSLLVRMLLGFPEHILALNDLLLVVQNNPCGLMNGDFVTVRQIANKEVRAGLTFLYVNVEEITTKRSYSLLLIHELLFSRQANLTPEQHKALFVDFHIRTKKKHPGIKQKSKEYVDLMRYDPYVNALRATFGYVVTCHKAQGGEWNDVYLDISKLLSRTPPRQNYQWLYTAITRAKENLHIVNDFYLM